MNGVPFNEQPDGGRMPNEFKLDDSPEVTEESLSPNEERYFQIESLDGAAFVDAAVEVLKSSYDEIAKNSDYSKAAILEAIRKELKVPTEAEREWNKRFLDDARFRINNLPEVDPDDAVNGKNIQNEGGYLH